MELLPRNANFGAEIDLQQPLRRLQRSRTPSHLLLPDNFFDLGFHHDSSTLRRHFLTITPVPAQEHCSDLI